MNDQEIKIAEAIFKYAKNVKKPFSHYDVANYRKLDFNVTSRVLGYLRKNEGCFRYADTRKTLVELTKKGRNFTTWKDHLAKEAKKKKYVKNKRQLTAGQIAHIKLVLEDWKGVKNRAKSSLLIAVFSALIALAALMISIFSK